MAYPNADTGFQTSNFTPATSPNQVLPASLVSVDTGLNAAGPATVALPLSLIAQAQAANNAITARAGGTQALATQVGYGFTNVAVAATAADSIKLPPAVAGAWCFIRNNGAASMQVFGGGTSTINGVATATGVAQANAKGGLYFCTSGTGDDVAGAWQQLLGA